MARVWQPKIPQGHAALREAIDLCGSKAELARRVARFVPCTASRMEQWLRLGMPVPPAFAPFIAQAVDNRVSVLRLCPEYERGWALLSEQLPAIERERRKKKVPGV
ncbi:hypothetical protein [Paraburkholderia sp. 35.1]|uniref:hypothetical protein n=1 Tax=Paraburkholderia sp. 35.1 TaxID=2991058 RepID=UPI003D2606E8